MLNLGSSVKCNAYATIDTPAGPMVLSGEYMGQDDNGNVILRVFRMWFLPYSIRTEFYNSTIEYCPLRHIPKDLVRRFTWDGREVLVDDWSVEYE
jgi:hypothetical protein